MEQLSGVGFCPGRLLFTPQLSQGGLILLLGKTGGWQRPLTPGLGSARRSWRSSPGARLSPAAWGLCGGSEQDAVLGVLQAV